MPEAGKRSKKASTKKDRKKPVRPTLCLFGPDTLDSKQLAQVMDKALSSSPCKEANLVLVDIEDHLDAATQHKPVLLIIVCDREQPDQVRDFLDRLAIHQLRKVPRILLTQANIYKRGNFYSRQDAWVPIEQQEYFLPKARPEPFQ